MTYPTGTAPSATDNQFNKQAFQILRFGFTVAPILLGLDKFFHLLVDWG